MIRISAPLCPHCQRILIITKAGKCLVCATIIDPPKEE